MANKKLLQLQAKFEAELSAGKKLISADPILKDDDLRTLAEDYEESGCPYCGSYEGDATECPECGHGQ